MTMHTDELKPYDAYEISYVGEWFPGEEDKSYCEVLSPETLAKMEALGQGPHKKFWTLYGHIPDAGVEAIADYESFGHAREQLERILGRRLAGDSTNWYHWFPAREMLAVIDKEM
jgi:hypothetical protein